MRAGVEVTLAGEVRGALPHGAGVVGERALEERPRAIRLGLAHELEATRTDAPCAIGDEHRSQA